MKDRFTLFISTDIIQEICIHTNNHCQGVNRPERPIEVDEIYAFIGILLSSGRNRGRKLQLSELWTSEFLFRQPFFTAAMSRNRFIYIYTNIRFDDKATRQMRMDSSGDKLEAI